MPSYTETCGHLLLVHLAIDPILLVWRTIEHEQVLRTDLNNSEIRYTKNYAFSCQGGGVHTQLTLYVYATGLKKGNLNPMCEVGPKTS